MSSSSDRSSTSTPSSESGSTVSNSTIIFEATQPTQSTPTTHHNTNQPTSRHGSGRSGNGSRTDASNSICSPALTSSNNGSNGNGAFTVRLEHHGGNRWSSSVTNSSLSGRKTHQHNHQNNQLYNENSSRQEQTGDSSGNSRDQNYNNSNQRITRSSQRAAQQVKQDNNHSDSNNCDDNHQVENEKDSGRKVKRRKGESLQDIEQDNSQLPAVPQPPAMANICPADYQLPTQNSFQLYREIKNLSSRELKKLNHVQPKTPHGFKEYLLNSGLYSLDRIDISINNNSHAYNGGVSSGPITKNSQSASFEQANYKKPTNFKKTLAKSACPTLPNLTSNVGQQQENNILPNIRPTNDSHQQTTKFVPSSIAKLLPPPSKLEKDSALYLLFKEHELARQQMRIQHLKERERLILSAEQEILRTYNRAAIADRRQKHPLSACTYLYYQERYHYSDKSSDKKQEKDDKQEKQTDLLSSEEDPQDSKDKIPSSTDYIDSLNGGGNVENDKSAVQNCDFNKVSVANNPVESDIDVAKVITKQDRNTNNDKQQDDINYEKMSTSAEIVANETKFDENSCDINPTLSENDTNDNSGSKLLIDELTLSDADSGVTKTDSVVKTDSSDQNQAMDLDEDNNNQVNDTDTMIDDDNSSRVNDLNDDKNANNNINEIEERISDEDSKILNKDIFLEQLQEIDEKWEKIRNDMLVRHRNEADSLFAVQSMEWEWKSKELGLCDHIREPFKLEAEFVPRIEIITYDY